MDDTGDLYANVPEREEATLPQPTRVIAFDEQTQNATRTSEENKQLWNRAATMQRLYPYRPLEPDTTRLLMVYPKKKGTSGQDDDQDDDLFADMVHVPFSELGSKIQYEALSYHWGNDPPSQHINITNDWTHRSIIEAGATPSGSSFAGVVGMATDKLLDKKILLRNNLYQAVKHIRDSRTSSQTGKRIKLWIDAICINQADKDEKQAQIGKLAHVFSQAQRVLVWLGPGDAQTKKAMAFVKEVVNLDKLQDLLTQKDRLPAWDSLLHLMHSSWFSRRWVIQELALAQKATVLCGEDETNWVDFRDAIYLFYENFDLIRELTKNSAEHEHDFHAMGDPAGLGAKVLVDCINNVFRGNEMQANGSSEDLSEWQRLRMQNFQPEPTKGLEYLVSYLSKFDSGDPRDTIFALRNIAKETYWSRFNDMVRAPPIPDYSVTTTLLDVYKSFITWIVEGTGSVDILCRNWALPEKPAVAGEDGYRRVVLPSWIKLFNDGEAARQGLLYLDKVTGDSFVGMPGQQMYNACLHQPAVLRFGNSEKEIKKIRSPQVSLPHRRSDTHQLSEHQLDNWEGCSRFASLDRQKSTISSYETAEEQYTNEALNLDRTFSAQYPNTPGYFPESPEALPKRLHPAADVGGPSCRPQARNDAGVEDRAGRTGSQTTHHRSQSPENIDNRHDSPVHVQSPRELKKDPPQRHQSPYRHIPRTNRSFPQTRKSTYDSTITNATDYFDLEDLKLYNKRLDQHREGSIDATLSIQGIKVGRIIAHSDMTDGVIKESTINKLKGIGNSEREFPGKLWRTLVAERGPDGTNPLTSYERACGWCMANRRPPHLNVKTMMAKNLPPTVLSFLKRVNDVVLNRRFFELVDYTGEQAQRIHGIGPEKLEQNDLVCILFGCSVPVILRRHNEEGVGEFYSFVGEAYVYGLMDGEVISKMGKGEVEVNTEFFRLL